MHLFVYGTLKRGFNNNRLLYGAQFQAECHLSNYQMYSLGGFPAITKKDNSVIMGEVWKIEHHHLKLCDRLEGHPEWYTRYLVHLKDFDLPVWTYTMSYDQVENYPIVESGYWQKKN